MKTECISRKAPDRLQSSINKKLKSHLKLGFRIFGAVLVFIIINILLRILGIGKYDTTLKYGISFAFSVFSFYGFKKLLEQIFSLVP